MATYPSGIYVPVVIVDGVDYPQAIDVNLQNNEIVAIQTELGLDPAGSLTDVVTRLAVSLADDGDITLNDSSTLTIASGIITATGNLHKVDTQGAAASDDLDTITAAADGFLLILSPANAAHVVTIKHGTGNIYVVDNLDIAMSSANDMVLLVYSTALSGWRAMYTGKRQVAVQTKTAAYTALMTDDTILCDATSAAFSVTLMAATSALGKVLTIKKVDVSVNAVTVDANASETIDGATTKVLSSQYDSVTIVCDGSEWFIV